MNKSKALSILNEYGTDVCLADMENLDIEAGSDNPITLKGTIYKFLVLAFFSICALVGFKYLIATNSDGVGIKHSLGWFTLIPLIPIVYFTHSDWKVLAHIKYIGLTLSISWGIWFGSLVGAFDSRFDNLASHVIVLLIAIIVATVIAFKLFRFRDRIASNSLKIVTIILINLISTDFIMSIIDLKYQSILISGTGTPTLLLMIYMLTMASVFIPVELSNLQIAIEKKASKESEWLFATRLILACYNIMIWLLFLVMSKLKK